MTISPLVYWAAGFLVVSLAGLYITSKTIKIDLDKNGELVVAMLTILGTLVSVLLGLLVSSADEQYRLLEESVNSEATKVNQVFRLARGLSAPTSYVVQDHCINYCEKVISAEWPEMKNGEMSEDVTQIFTDMSDAIVMFRPVNDGEAVVQSALLEAANDLGQNRGTRIVASRSSWTRRLLPLILTCAIVVLACSYLYANRGSALLHYVLVGLVAVTLGINIGVIVLMTGPFSSEWAIQPEGFKIRLELMREFRHPTLRDGRPAL